MARKCKVNSYSVQTQTDRQRHFKEETARKALVWLTDPHRKERHEAQECVICFGGSRIGGASCTTVECGLCGEDIHFGSTCVDVLCLECARKAKLCKHCGADIDLVNRRQRPWPENLKT